MAHSQYKYFFYVLTTGFFVLYSCYMTQLDVPSRQTTPTQHIRVLGSSFRCLEKEGKRPQNIVFPCSHRCLCDGCSELMGGRRVIHVRMCRVPWACGPAAVRVVFSPPCCTFGTSAETQGNG